MSLVQFFLKSFRESDTLEPGLFEKVDGTVWLRQPDGSEVQITGGGGSGFTGWTEDASNPANVATNGGGLDMGTGEITGEGTAIDLTDGMKELTASANGGIVVSDSGAGTQASMGANGVFGGVQYGGVPANPNDTVFDAQSGALANVGNATLGANGPTDTLSFYGANPATQPAAPTTLGDVIAGLQALGLFGT